MDTDLNITSALADLAETIFSSESEVTKPTGKGGSNECAVCLTPFKHHQVNGARTVPPGGELPAELPPPSTIDVGLSRPSPRRCRPLLPTARAPLSVAGAQAAAVRSHVLQALYQPLDGGAYDVPDVPHRLPIRQRGQRHLPPAQSHPQARVRATAL